MTAGVGEGVHPVAALADDQDGDVVDMSPDRPADREVGHGADIRATRRNKLRDYSAWLAPDACR